MYSAQKEILNKFSNGDTIFFNSRDKEYSLVNYDSGRDYKDYTSDDIKYVLDYAKKLKKVGFDAQKSGNIMYWMENMMTLEEALGVVIKESIYDVDLETEELIVDTFVHGSYILKNVLGSYLLLDKNLKEEYSLKKIKSQEIQKILEKMKNSKDSSKIKSVKIPLGILYFIG